jgi:anaerobic magnesium-protoporphyrin IX monomethyl ester cyclase
MVRDCMPDDIGMSVSYPLPGTTFHARVQDQLREQQNWFDSSDLAMMYSGPFATAFYRKLHTVLHKEYRARKHWKELKGTATNPSRFRKVHLRRLAVMLFYTISLPFERYQLKRLEKAPHTGIDTLPEGMSQMEAARPTPQTD